MRHLILILMASSQSVFGLNWPEWRGPHRTGVTGETNLPVHWSTNENVRWRTPLAARGNSTPIVWENRVFITQATEIGSGQPARDNQGTAKRAVVSLDRRNGKILWES